MDTETIEIIKESCAIVCCSCFVPTCLQEKCPVYHMAMMLNDGRSPLETTTETYEICEKYFSTVEDES